MKKLKKIMTGLTSAAVLAVSMTSLSANAITKYGYYQTPSLITDQWCKTPTISITGSNNKLYAGDFGVFWYDNGVGLDTKFVRDTSRKVSIQLYEEDANGTDTLVKHQTATFAVKPSGIYRTTYYTGETIENEGIVEYDDTAEVYMKLKVDYISGDKTRNIPAGLMLYKYWID